MKFKKTKEYPDGSVVIAESDIELLKAKGWTVDLHTPYYANFIGTKSMGIVFGFASWHSALDFNIYAENEYGGYYTPDGYEVKISSTADLKKAISIIDNIIALEKIIKSI